MNNNARPLFHFYIDDSGTRNPDHAQCSSPVGDWFGLGGIIVGSEHEGRCRALHREFCEKWRITYPLHSIKIRHKSDEFSWLATLSQPKLREFFSDLDRMIELLPVVAMACVIDRPGYHSRYYEKYGRQPWQLCKTAYSVLSERVCKFAMKHDRRVKLYVEKTDKSADRAITDYHNELRQNGMPFAPSSSAKHKPLSPEALKFRLLDLRFKTKSSPMIQLADLFLYPMCRNGYDEMYRPYHHLNGTNKLIQCHLTEDENEEFGAKYSCFD